MKTEDKIYRPKTRGELYNNLLDGKKSEVLYSNVAITKLLLDSLIFLQKSDLKYKTHKGENPNFVIFEKE